MVLELESTVRYLEQTIRKQGRITELEDRARRNKVIVYGVKESAKETRGNIERKVFKDIFLDRLEVDVSSLERIYRLGKKKDDRNRPVIMKLYNFNEKVALFKNGHKWKGSKIHISDDYSPETLKKRTHLGNG